MLAFCTGEAARATVIVIIWCHSMINTKVLLQFWHLASAQQWLLQASHCQTCKPVT